VQKYPTITFDSTYATGKLAGGHFDVEIGGRITLHGVTHQIIIPATVTLNGTTLNAKGHFELNRSDFGVKATSAFHGWVSVKERLSFTFDINAKETFEG
ncbi:MAG: YceI family protein, partial [Pyrinomonadaceae bacterium]